LRSGLGRPQRLLELMSAALRHPSWLVALIVILCGTRREPIRLTESDAGQALRRYFSERFLRVFPKNLWCRGVLVLPDDHSDYLRGRRRQALRTNLRRAARAGITCEVVTEPEVALAAAAEIVDKRRAPTTEEDIASLSDVWPALFARSGVTLTVARGPDGRPQAVIAAVIDDQVCLIEVAVARSHDARWALHDHLVRLLIDRRVRFLLAEGLGPLGALGYHPDVHHFQRLLGYELRHLSLS
jgi:hypothetical protein